jgi:hypothetical protein
VGDFRNLALGEQFDVIYFAPWTYAFIQGRERRIEVWRGLASKLTEGGVIVISFGLGQGSNWVHARFAIAKVASVLTRGNPDLQPRDRLAGNLFIHFFLDGEGDREAAEAGFKVLHKQNDGPNFYTLIVRTLNGGS